MVWVAERDVDRQRQVWHSSIRGTHWHHHHHHHHNRYLWHHHQFHHWNNFAKATVTVIFILKPTVLKTNQETDMDKRLFVNPYWSFFTALWKSKRAFAYSRILVPELGPVGCFPLFQVWRTMYLLNDLSTPRLSFFVAGIAQFAFSTHQLWHPQY